MTLRDDARDGGERRRTRRRHEDRLHESGFADAFADLPDGVVLTDARGIVVSANSAAARILGLPRLVGQSLDAHAGLRSARTVEETAGHLVRRAEFTRDERPCIVEIVSSAVSAGDPRQIHTLRDITAQAELLRLKEDFLLQVAHELRTPIAAMSASLDLVLQDALTIPREQLAMLLRTLSRSALRLENLVENLLDVGSIEAGTFQVRALPTFLSRAIQTSLTFVQPVLDGKQQRLEVHVAREAETVVADPRRTAQVLTNLLVNASKYSPESTAIEVIGESAGGFVRVTVKDHGQGIPLDEQERLFERFFRSRDVREQAGGLGLGLTISRAIVHAQGGEIGIESVPGAGTSVHFTLPRARERAAEAGH